MLAPTIHSNGDTRKTLKDGMADAYKAVGKAIDAMSGMTPNGRNYYTQGEKAFEVAREDYMNMVKKLVDVRTEILATYQAIDK